MNAYQSGCIAGCFGGPDAFVTKLNATGNALVYSTYLGGSGHNQGNAVAVDSAGNAYVTGYTDSHDFPTMNPFQSALVEGDEAFVTKLNASGTALVYSTYLGGSVGDQDNGIAVDSSGKAYVTGPTDSPDFPTVNPIQAALGGTDAFVTKVNAEAIALVYSTYLGGGSGIAIASGIAVDAWGAAYVTGFADSPDFPTVNPVQATLAGGIAAFVTKLNVAGDGLVYSTSFGRGLCCGPGPDIALDSAGGAYMTGTTDSSDSPTVNPLQARLGGPSAVNAFVAKIASTVPFASFSKA
jgi:hypothetical protein